MILFSLVYYNMKSILHYSHKKRKDSLETWAEQAVFFITWVPKIIRNQSTRSYMKYKQFKVKGLSSCFVLNLRISGENCLIFNWHSSRATPGISFLEYQQRMTNINWRNNISAVTTRDTIRWWRQFKKTN